jgi:hypothetical protein
MIFVESKASRIWAVRCACWGASEANIRGHPGSLLAVAGRRALGDICECQVKTPPRKGLTTEAGVLCSGAPTTGEPPRADTQLV